MTEFQTARSLRQRLRLVGQHVARDRPDDAELLSQLSWTYLEVGDTAQSVALAERALRSAEAQADQELRQRLASLLGYARPRLAPSASQPATEP